MYKIKSLEITNFKSYKGTHSIPFEDHFTCIIGPNGSGKSNILDAIVFCLTNKPYNIKNSTVKLICIFNNSITYDNYKDINKDDINKDNINKIIKDDNINKNIKDDNKDIINIKDDNKEMTFTRYINNSGKSSYFINNKKSLYKEYINNFIIYQSHTDLPLNTIIEQISGSIKYKQEYDTLINKYSDLLIKLKIESESKKQYLNLIKDNKKYEEEYKKNLELVERKKELEELIFNHKINTLLRKYKNIKNIDRNTKIKKEALKMKIDNIKLKIDHKQDLIDKIDKDLIDKNNNIIENFNELEKEYFKLLNNQKIECEIIEDSEEIINLKEKYTKLMEEYNTLNSEIDNLNTELNNINNEILLNKNIKTKNIKLYNLKSKIKKLPGIIGFIPDLVTCTNEKYKVAVRALLGQYESTVIVEDDESAFNCIKYCKDHRLGRVSCITNAKNTTNSNNENSKYSDNTKYSKNSKYSDNSKNSDNRNNENSKYSNMKLIMEYSDDIRNTIEYLLGGFSILDTPYINNRSINNKSINYVTSDGVIIKSKGRIINITKNTSDSSSLERRSEILDKLALLKRRKDSFPNIEVIKNKISDLQVYKKKNEVFLPEKTVFGDIFIKNGYKNYADYINKNTSLEEREIKKKVLLEKKSKLINKLTVDKEELERYTVLYEELPDFIEEEGDINCIEEEIKDLYFKEKNVIIDNIFDNLIIDNLKNDNIFDLNLKNDNINNKDPINLINDKDMIDNLINELEGINKSLSSTFLIKNTLPIQKPESYEKIKKETLEVKASLNIVKNKRRTLFLECIEKINILLQSLFNKVYNNTTSVSRLVCDDPEEVFNSVKYYIMVPNKKYKEYSFLSGGEQMISRIVLMYSINKYNNLGFLLLDEVDSNLDNNNVCRLVEFIKNENVQVVMVSLKVGVYKESNKMIGVYKKGGVSNVLHYKI